MPINKNAMIRYQALDRCLQNRQKRFYINDLIDACNRALAEVNGIRGSKERRACSDVRYSTTSTSWKTLSALEWR